MALTQEQIKGRIKNIAKENKADAIVLSIERKFEQEQPKKKHFGFWHKRIQKELDNENV